LTTEERTAIRGTCQTIKQNIPKPDYFYFTTKFGIPAGRIETNIGFVETCESGDSSNVSTDLQFDVRTIVCTGGAFAALKKNGSHHLGPSICGG
jgi:hypothetical protein